MSTRNVRSFNKRRRVFSVELGTKTMLPRVTSRNSTQRSVSSLPKKRKKKTFSNPVRYLLDGCVLDAFGGMNISQFVSV